MAGTPMSKEIHKLLLAITGVILTWMFVVPIFEFPDEQAHFETVTFVQDQGRVSVGNEKDMTEEMYRTQQLLGVLRNHLGQNKYTYHPEYRVEYTDGLIGKYEAEIQALNTTASRSTYVAEEAASYPILYYRFMSFFTALAGKGDLFLRLFVTRLGGLLIGAGIAYLTWLIGLQVFKDKALAVTLTVITMLQPMMSFVTAGINSDNLHNLWFMAVIYFCLQLVKAGVKLKYLIILGALVILDIYTKPQGFITLAVIGVAIMLTIILHRSWKSLIWIFILASAAILATSDQWTLYRGLLSINNTSGTSLVEYFRFSANKLLAQNVVWYWGVFKWLGVVLPPIYWRVANRVVLVSIFGLAIYAIRVIKKQKTIADPNSLFFLILVSVIYAFIIFWFDWQYLKNEGFSLGIQARYFFPTLVAHMAILLTGIVSLGWNHKTRTWLKSGIVLLFVWLQLGGIWRVISIYYDTSSLVNLINQLSQYKPGFIKGSFWYFWGALYLASLGYLAWCSMRSNSQKVAKSSHLP